MPIFLQTSNQCALFSVALCFVLSFVWAIWRTSPLSIDIFTNYQDNQTYNTKHGARTCLFRVRGCWLLLPIGRYKILLKYFLVSPNYSVLVYIREIYQNVTNKHFVVWVPMSDGFAKASQVICATKDGIISHERLCPFQNFLDPPMHVQRGERVPKLIPLPSSAIQTFMILKWHHSYIHFKCNVVGSIFMTSPFELVVILFFLFFFFFLLFMGYN